MSSEIAKAYVHVIPTTEGIQGSLEEIFGGGSGGGEIGKAGASIGSGLGSAIVNGFVGLGVGKMIGSAFSESFETGKAFDTAMSQVAATMGKSVDEITELRDVAKEMGSTTAFTATEAAEGLNYLALAGYTTEQQMAALPTVLNLAAAGAMDLGSASDMVTDAMSALGIEVTQSNLEGFVDELAKTASSSNTSVAQLGEAILTVGGTAKGMAGGTVEMATALGIMADNGIKGAEGGTHLRNVLLALNPTTDKAVAAWEKLGVSAYDADGNLRPLEDTFGDLNKAMEGMSYQEKQDLLTSMFNKTDLSAVNALLGTSAERWDELGEAIENSSGAAENMAKTQLDNLGGALTLMDSALDGLKLSFYETFAGSLTDQVQNLTGAIGGLQAFVDGNSESITAFFDSLGSVGDSSFALMAEGVALFLHELETDGTPINEAVEGITSFVTNDFGLIGTAIDGVTKVLGIFKDDSEKKLPVVSQYISLWGMNFSLWFGLANGVVTTLTDLLNGDFTKAWTDIKGTIGGAKDTIWVFLDNEIGLGKLFSNLGSKMTDVKGTIIDDWTEIKAWIDEKIEQIKGLMNFSWHLPAPALPQINWHWEEISAFGIHVGSYPWFDGITWHDKAMDNPWLLDGATIFGSLGGQLLGGGETGQEIIYGRDALMADIAEASNNGESIALLQQMLDVFEEYFPQMANAKVLYDRNQMQEDNYRYNSNMVQMGAW